MSLSSPDRVSHPTKPRGEGAARREPALSRGPRTSIWYVAYGSNLAAARLACYLEGGCPPGGSRVNPGARDRTLPTRSEPVDLPGTTYFAGRSPQWGGGVAFYDPDEPGRTAARAFLVTAGQLADIAAQEMYRLPADGDPLEQVVLGPADRHTCSSGSPSAGRRYISCAAMSASCPAVTRKARAAVRPGASGS